MPKNPALAGKAAIAAAKVAYSDWQEQMQGGFAPLVQAGAQPQLLLWASTGTKNADYRDTLYVEELIGPQTVDTVPDATMAAFRDHGVASLTLTSNVPAAQQVLQQIAGLGIDLEAIGQDLLQAGLQQFDDAYAKLLELLK
jgi:transaldolase